jgi:hypothetical protein
MVDSVPAVRRTTRGAGATSLRGPSRAEIDRTAGHLVGTIAMPRIPLQVVALVGLTAGGYAASLAAVTALQSSSDAIAAAEREPLIVAVRDAAIRNDALASALTGAVAEEHHAADAYATLLDDIASTESALAGLSSSVAAVDGASRALPARIALPRAVRTTIQTARPGTAHATTGGSGAP